MTVIKVPSNIPSFAKLLNGMIAMSIKVVLFGAYHAAKVAIPGSIDGTDLKTVIKIKYSIGFDAITNMDTHMKSSTRTKTQERSGLPCDLTTTFLLQVAQRLIIYKGRSVILMEVEAEAEAEVSLEEITE